MGIPKGANFRLEEVPSGIDVEPLDIVTEDGATTRALLYRPAGRRPRVGVHLLHPRTDQTQNYNIIPLVRAGYAVLGRAGRWVNNDISTIHEHLLLDVAAGVRALHDLGCDAVILLGNSGGGPLSALYQAQARKTPEARYKTTAAGTLFDLGRFDLPPADGMVMIGAHLGQGYCLAKWLDPSMCDDADALSVDPELDMYNPGNGFRVPPEASSYSADFLARFRAAQAERGRRLDETARHRIAVRRAAIEAAELFESRGKTELALAQRRRARFTNHMAVWRASADPAWLDPTYEPDDRDICAFNNEARPDLQNFVPFLSPFLSPDAYLSTWSGLSGRALTVDRLAEVRDPLIVVHYAGDGTTQIREARRMCDESGAEDRSFELIRNVDHYSFEIVGPHRRGPRSMAGTDAVVAWMESRFPLGD